jgi:cellulose synthase/poly-beta-1,6-N-acetylglucosamine synthase-like glycosyltransferase
MEEQTRKPDEIVILDAGSKDGTWEVLEDYAKHGSIPLKLLRKDRCKPAASRNLCAKEASYDVLAVTDIGCDWKPQWFEELIAPFETRPRLEAVMGSWKVRWEDQRTAWAQADPLLRGSLELRATPKSHAANRAVAYTKRFYFQLGGLPEDLSFACDDMSLAILIQAHGQRLAAAPEPRCIWERPQTFRALVKESYRNYKGAGEALVFLDHFLINSTRFALETLTLAGIALAFIFHSSSTIRLSLIAMSVLLFAWRLRNWVPHWLTLRRRGTIATLAHIALLDYATRWSAVRGYFAGLRYGAVHCHDCRSKLQAAGRRW